MTDAFIPAASRAPAGRFGDGVVVAVAVVLVNVS